MRHAFNGAHIRIFNLRTLATLVLVVTPALNRSEAEEGFPYTALVQANEVAVRSGPGEEFYETERLSTGAAVEVYRHVDDGWCAIRPLKDSFSWVAAEHLEIMDKPSLARVINVPAKTRVGSKSGDVHDVEYISLRKGEFVELLGSKILREATDEQPRRWFKIAPPSGEFRWVHEKGLSRTASLQTTSSEEHRSTASMQQHEKNVGGKIASTIKLHPLEVAPTFIPSTNREELTEFSPSNAPVEQLTFAQTEPFAGAAETTKEHNSTHVNAVTWQAVGARTNILAAPEPRSFLDQYNAVNVVLSRAVLDDILDWDFLDVHSQATLLIEHAATPDEKEMAESLLAKVDEFKALKRRSDEMNESPIIRQVSAEVDEPAKLPALTNEPIGSVSLDMPKIVRRQPKHANPISANLQRRNTVDNSVFDATGILISVRSRRGDIPRYALTDSSGQITRFVSPGDGDNLSSFVNKRVGIIGKSGFLRALNKPYMISSKVVYLKR